MAACWQPSQVRVGPQLQTSPHWQALGAGAEFWQPHVHWVPTQVSHPQTFDGVVMRSSFSVLTSCQQRKGVSHRGGQTGLDGAAVVVERIGYSVGRGNRGRATSPDKVLNGEGISMKSPRINTEGAMPTIW